MSRLSKIITLGFISENNGMPHTKYNDWPDKNSTLFFIESYSTVITKLNCGYFFKQFIAWLMSRQTQVLVED